MPDLIGATLGPYRILEQIGRGGMAVVYKAYQPGMDRLVALKVLPEHYAQNPLFVQRFQLEARVIARLEHANIVPVYDFGEQDGIAYLVLRYLQAGTVRETLIAAQGPLPLPDTAHVVADVAAALDYAHAQGTIHRDVKPSNIMVDRQSHSYLTDFGLAKVLETAAELTGSGGMLGTPTYMSPEQTLGQPVSPQTDVYSLGVTLFEMATGRPPYEADTAMTVALMHVHAPLPLPRLINPHLPPAVELVLVTALAKAPQDRYPSAGALARAFATAAGAEPHAAPARLIELARDMAATKSGDEVTADLRREIRRQERGERLAPLWRWAPWAAAGMIIVALAVGALLAWRQSVQVRATSAQTATAVWDLLQQLGSAQTAVAGGGGAELGPTVEFLQTQLAGVGVAETGTGTRAATLTAPATPTRTAPQPTPAAAAGTLTPQVTPSPAAAAATRTPAPRASTTATQALPPTGTAPAPTNVPLSRTATATPAPPTAPATATPPTPSATAAPPTPSATTAPSNTPVLPIDILTNTPILPLPTPTIRLFPAMRWMTTTLKSSKALSHSIYGCHSERSEESQPKCETFRFAQGDNRKSYNSGREGSVTWEAHTTT